jgi:hypothetical protein
VALIMLFRTGKAPRKLAEANVNKRIGEVKKKGARVKRDDIIRFMFGGGFASLPITRQSIIDNPIARAEATGWVIPTTSLGRKGEASQSQAESVRLWIKQNLNIDGEDFAVIYIPDEG